MPAIQKSGADDITIINMMPAWQPVHIVSQPVSDISSAANAAWSTREILLLLYVLVSIILLLRMVIQFISLKKMISQAQLISDADIKLYHINKDIIPFSFGKAIFINTQLHSEAELKEIISHELVHVKQNHSIDIIWAEILCIINWFNPFAWWLRHAIRQNLEFIADNKVVEAGTDKTVYQYLLLEVSGNHKFSIASPFNFSSLKKRIFMMNKIQTGKIHLLKFLFILPLMVVLLLAFRSNTKEVAGKNIFTVAGLVIDEITLQPVEGVIIGDNISGVQTVSDVKGYYALQIPITSRDSLNVRFRYEKAGYSSSKENGGIMVRNPVEQNNDIVLFSIQKGKQGVGISGYGSARKNNVITEPDYALVYEKYLKFLEGKGVDALVRNSTSPVHIFNGIPYVFGKYGKAWFDKEEVDASPECKVWIDGKIVTIEEANKNYNRFDYDYASAMDRTRAKETLGVDCNLLILIKDSANPAIRRPVK